VTSFALGALVRARGREWVVVADHDDDLVVLRPLGGGDDDTTAVLPSLEPVTAATFRPPGVADLGDESAAALLRTALQIGFRSTGGPFRSLARLAVEPRAYQYVPLLLALRQDPVRLLIADDVGIGKTIEAGLIAAELLAQGTVARLAVLCGPALAGQWRSELGDKFGIDAEVVLPSTAGRLTRNLLNESLFDRYPYVVVSTDFIKSPNRRADFINHCPELVIVDEAHGAVADGSGRGTRARTLRYDLMRAVAADRRRHLVLVTATPHSGKEEGFRNLLGLLDPALATVDLDNLAGRQLLARHFVQRRRADIRRYLSEDTAFPSDRQSHDSPYQLSPEYAAFFDRVLAYARGHVKDASAASGVRQRVRWWSALALLRALASSPAAAASTLRTRASVADATSVEEADELGRAAVLDAAGDDDALEGMDTTPGVGLEADPDTEAESSGPARSERRRLGDLARSADDLVGPAKDRKLAKLIQEVKALLADGFDPIVFCRFIDTADYVAGALRTALGKAANVEAVTGTLPPDLREARIAALTELAGRHVLVATDCLSEGVNLQDHFQAVIHYDLAWNPTRHEQREGRVDRFGQPADIVRAVTIYGSDNSIDRIVLDVLIRKYRAIRAATGVSIPVPDGSDNVVEALVEGLILGAERTGTADQLGLDLGQAEQMTLELGLAQQRDNLHRDWESAAEREKTSRTKYAQEAIHPDDVAREVAAARAALGEHHDIERFAVEALRCLGASLTATPDGYDAVTSSLPVGLRDALPAGHAQPLPLHRDVPAPRSHAVLERTDPAIEALARYVLDTALDPALGKRAATRAGVIRTKAVTRRTTVLLVRFRLQVDMPTPAGVRQLVAEEARFVALAGPTERPDWLEPAAVEDVLAAQADANVTAEQAGDLIERAAAGLETLAPALDDLADRLADELLDAHRRARSGAGAPRRGLAVTANKPVDLLGIYVSLPMAVT